jgi:hypothetical protein
MVEVLTADQWAQRHFGDAELGDKRRTRRAVKYAAAAAHSPGQSIPRQCDGVWGQTKGAYRLYDNPNVSFEKLQEPHRRLTISAASERAVTLWVSDTTTLSFDHPETAGLGPTSPGGSGMLLHSTMAIDVSGGVDGTPFVLGLGHQQLWARPTRRVKNKPPESAKWHNGIEAIGTPPAGVRWVHVGDCESDCWETIESCLAAGSGVALRACQNRLVIAGHDPIHGGAADSGEPTPLFELLQKQPMLGGKRLFLRARKDRPARWAKLAVSATPVTLLAPKNWSDKPHRKGRPRPGPIACWAVRVWEIDAPEGQEPIEWVILTDEPVTDLAGALKVVFWYSCRWLIEEYHKCLKSGCQVESRQLEEAGRLKSLLGVLAVVAVRLLQIKHQAKVDPDAPATRIVPARYVRTLAARLKRPHEKMTAREFWRETARMGGFLGRKGDGDPGWLTLWRGWEELEVLTEGFELAEKMRGRCG